MSQRSSKGIWLSWTLAAALALPAAVLAEPPASVTIADVDIRYKPQEGELCLTRNDIPQEALSLLGADETIIRRAMEAGSLYLLVLTADGRQVSLRVTLAPPMHPFTDPPADQNESALSPTSPEEQLLHFLQRDGGYHSGIWLDQFPGFALLSTVENAAEAEFTNLKPGEAGETIRPAGLHTLALATLHQNQIISYQTDIFGREPSQADEDLLIATAMRSVLPDVLWDGQNLLALSPQVPLTSENVAFSYTLGAPPLEIIPIPAIVGSTSLSFSGRTAPNSFLKYTVNGRASSRIKADEEGAFSATMKNLIPDANNEIAVIVYGNVSNSTATGNVFVQWQPTPIVLSQAPEPVLENRITLHGSTLPGAKVQLLLKLETVSIPVQNDGSFTCNVLLNKIGENTFTIRALAQGYKREDVEVTIVRTSGADNP